MSHTIRKASLEDADAITRVIREPGLFPRLEGEAAETTARRVRRHLELCLQDDSHSVYVAEAEGGQVIGYLSAHWLPYLMLSAPEGYISELFVLGSARGTGAGRALLERARQEAEQRGCGRLSLLNMRTRESYRRGFYAQNGWEERPEAVNFIYKLSR